MKSSAQLRKLLLCCSAVILLAFALLPSAFCGEEKGKWPGVDESVVEKYAKEHGREAQEPLINTDQGDLLLFVFLIAGAAGGFVAGYTWRILMVEKSSAAAKERQTTA